LREPPTTCRKKENMQLRFVSLFILGVVLRALLIAGRRADAVRPIGSSPNASDRNMLGLIRLGGHQKAVGYRLSLKGVVRVAPTRAPYPPEFKEETMRLLRSSGKPLAQISRELDVSEQTL